MLREAKARAGLKMGFINRVQKKIQEVTVGKSLFLVKAFGKVLANLLLTELTSGKFWWKLLYWR